MTLNLEDEDLDDQALMRIDSGAVDVIGTDIFQSGEFRGFQRFTSSDPGGAGRGVYSATLDLTKLEKGTHFIEAIAFLRREAGEPPAFRILRKVIVVEG